jgi:pepF/M3 family oligoendopeptidase
MTDINKNTHQAANTLQWDLESVFKGGSKSEDFKKYREDLKDKLDKLSIDFRTAVQKIDSLKTDELIDLINELQVLYHKLELVHALAGCLMSADVKDDIAFEIYSEAQLYESKWDSMKTNLEAIALKMDDTCWELLLGDNRMERIKFFVNEIRDIAKLKMSPEKEALALDLAVNGYHAWNNIYTKMAGDSTVEYEENGTKSEISLGQVALKMSSPDRNIRKTAFEHLTEAWKKNANMANVILNSQAGFRLSLYKNRGWKTALDEPLMMGRLQEKSLNAMWNAVLNAAPQFQKYIDTKKKLLGIDKFYWYDQVAPVGKASKAYDFQEASEFIIEQLSGFSTEMAEFSKLALENRWVEAENRPGKAAGGFCTGLGEIKESRIFMTFEDSYDSLLTLAHELGHAYHHHVLKDDPAFATFYTMGLAETASTFNELLVTDAALEQVTDVQEKIMLLEQKLSNGFTMFCNIHARFMFDKQFYIEREKGMVSRKRLDELMVESQKKAYCHMLDEDGYHPEFWASKLHFYETTTPFYNFPYTFGFLFSSAVYHKAKEEGASFADKYKAFLQDTGIMTSEEVAMKHLGFDLTDPKFWEWVTKAITDDIDVFVKLVEEN